MKFIDYIYESAKADVMEILDTQHDTLLGAFVKGLRHALEEQEKWIEDSEMTPERFEDFIVDNWSTRVVLIKHSLDGEEVMSLGHRLLVDEKWEWAVPGSTIKPVVIGWKRL